MLRYLLLVLLGSCSYGMLSTFVKLAYREGFTVNEVINGQYFFGWCMLLILVVFFSRKRIPMKKVWLLAAAGSNASLTGVFYGLSLETLSASVAVVVLFQFTWMGIVMESWIERQFPSAEKWIALLLLLTGTILASGIYGEHLDEVSIKGILYGLLAAVTFALFIRFSGSVVTDEPPILRSFWMMTGAVLLLWLVFSPSFLYNGSIPAGLWKYGLILGLLGIILPVVCFSIGVPKVGSGLSTILGAMELPTAVMASVFILKEEVPILQWLGIIIIFAGMAVPQMQSVGKKKFVNLPGK